jgi:hypothetical protein
VLDPALTDGRTLRRDSLALLSGVGHDDGLASVGPQ